MKKITLFAVLLSSFFFFSCDNEHDEDTSQEIPNSVKATEDFYGQRIESVDYADNDDWWFAGLVSTTAGTGCLGAPLSLNFPDPDWYAIPGAGDYNFSVYSGLNPLPVSTINYMNWGFMQTLAFS